MEPSSPTDSGIRKRVCKACDRCRLKKSKCDGASPCSRCKSDNAICFFGERKKSHDKVYPKGYVEMLESQQAQLVAGLQELYKRLQQGQKWSGSPLKEALNGAPLTHDILERLGALKQEGSTTDYFEENLEVLQQRLIANGALPMQRQASFDTGSDSDQSPLFDVQHQKAPSFVNPFTNNQFPPTPPGQSPYSSSVRTASPLKSQFNFDASQMAQYQAAYTPEFLDEMDLMTYEPISDMSLDPMAFSAAAYQGQGAINPCLTMKNWESLQDMQRHYAQSNVYA